MHHIDRDGRLHGVYAVTVGPDISDDPIRWLFAGESDADAFKAAIGDEATVTFEPISYDLDTDEHLREAFPDETRDARRLLRAES